MKPLGKCQVGAAKTEVATDEIRELASPGPPSPHRREGRRKDRRPGGGEEEEGQERGKVGRGREKDRETGEAGGTGNPEEGGEKKVL